MSLKDVLRSVYAMDQEDVSEVARGIRDSNQTKEGFIEIALIYSGFILSFMSGCIFYVSSLKKERSLLLWFCITPVLLATLSIIIPFMQSFVLALGFLVVLEIERKLHKVRSLPEWWLNLRFPMTSIVVVLLIFIGFRV